MRQHLILLLLLVLALPARAQPPAGSWRMAVEVGPGQSVVFLVALENAGGKWSGKYLGSTDPLAPETRIDDVSIAPNRVQFAIALRDQKLAFDGKPDGPRVPGTLFVDGQLLVTALEPSQLRTFDRYELAKEVFATTANPALQNQALQEMLRQATARKATVDDVRGWVERAAKAAEPLGVRWQQAVALGVVGALDGQPAFAALALGEARRADRLIVPADDVLVQLEILDALDRALRADGKAAEAAALATRVAQLEERDYREYSARPLLQVEPFKGRSGAGDRAVLVEEFTGANLQSAVGPDIAFEALGRVYKPTEVVRLQYHLHVPSGDPLASPAAAARRTYYGLKALPGLFLNGKPALDGEGGGRPAAAMILRQLRVVVDRLVEQPPGGRISASAARIGDVVTVRAVVNVLQPTDKLRLRLALVEDVVRYRGANGLRFHPCVVRGFVGGDAGLPLPKPANEIAQSLDLAMQRKTLAALLDAHLKANPDATFAGRPLAFKSLAVIAFVQDDATREVLQAVRIEVK